MASNQSQTETFTLTHNVVRDSYFKTILSTSEIQEAGKTTLGRFFVRNNTRDGFEVRLESTNDGTMAPTGTDDGEVAIPYDIEIAKTGTIGTGISSDLDHTTAELADEVTILRLTTAGVSATGSTDAAFTLSVEIDDDDNALGLAGEFSDTITLTYQDL